MLHQASSLPGLQGCTTHCKHIPIAPSTPVPLPVPFALPRLLFPFTHTQQPATSLSAPCLTTGDHNPNSRQHKSTEEQARAHIKCSWQPHRQLPTCRRRAGSAPTHPPHIRRVWDVLGGLACLGIIIAQGCCCQPDLTTTTSTRHPHREHTTTTTTAASKQRNKQLLLVGVRNIPGRQAGGCVPAQRQQQHLCMCMRAVPSA